MQFHRIIREAHRAEYLASFFLNTHAVQGFMNPSYPRVVKTKRICFKINHGDALFHTVRAIRSIALLLAKLGFDRLEQFLQQTFVVEVYQEQYQKHRIDD